MSVNRISTSPIEGQKPGTSGLRKKTAVFMGPHYLENFVQAIFDVAGAAGKTFVLGGDGRFFNELLPLPYSEEALRHVIERVQQMQDVLGRRVLIENVTAYVTFRDSIIPEWEFLNTLARTTGCGLLLDVNNVYVNSVNHGFDANQFIERIDARSVEEFHLAGYDLAGDVLVDTHGARVHEAVWGLYEFTLDRIGPRPTLIEWDNDIPALDVLLGEARRAQHLLARQHADAA